MTVSLQFPERGKKASRMRTYNANKPLGGLDLEEKAPSTHPRITHKLWAWSEYAS